MLPEPSAKNEYKDDMFSIMWHDCCSREKF